MRARAHLLNLVDERPREQVLEVREVALLLDGGPRVVCTVLGLAVGVLELGEDLLLAAERLLHRLGVGPDLLVLLGELRELGPAQEELQGD